MLNAFQSLYKRFFVRTKTDADVLFSCVAKYTTWCNENTSLIQDFITECIAVRKLFRDFGPNE